MCLAIPGELIRIDAHADPLWRMGSVRFGGVVRQVSLACVPEAQLGDQLLVHVGLALSIWRSGPAANAATGGEHQP